MSIGRIASNYLAGYEVKRTTRNTSGKGFDNIDLGENEYITNFVNTTRQTSVLDIYNSMNKFGGNIPKFVETKNMNEFMGAEEASRQESETKTEIIVKPDGSRVLVMTISVGGMETCMSLEISKPTKVPNENLKQNTDNSMPTAKNDDLERGWGHLIEENKVYSPDTANKLCVLKQAVS